MSRLRMRGLTLIEMMIAMALGVLLLAACAYFYGSSLSSTQATLDVSRLQESGRLVMELMGRDIRGAGDLLCDNRRGPGNLLAERDRPFWVTLAEPLKGLDAAQDDGLEDPALLAGSAIGQRLPGTPALRLWTVVPLALGVTAQLASDQPIAVAGADVPEVGSPLLICDFSMAVIVRVTATGAAIGHAAPANCVGYFMAPGLCPAHAPAPAAQHRFGADSALGRPHQVRWFVGNDEQQIASLYRQELVDGVVVAGGVVASGVTRFSLRYLLEGQGDYMAATQIAPAQWNQVRAVDVQLALDSHAGRLTDANISRAFHQTFSVRSRLQ